MSPGNGFHRSDSDGISPLHPYYSRDYRSTSHTKLRSRRTGVFPEVQVCVSEGFWGLRRVFQISENHDLSSRMGQKIVHALNPLTAPYSAPILWKLMIFWPNESSRRILCRKKCVQIMYSSINNSKIHPNLTKPTDRMGWIWTAYLLCIRSTLETTVLRSISSAPVVL